jgi:general secretion pathway protein K
MHRRTERGAALLAASIGLAILTVVAIGLAFAATTGTRLGDSAVAVVQAEALARSGIAAARAALLDAATVDAVEWAESPWLRPLDPQALGSGQVRVEVEDEARRIDPSVMPEAFQRLLGQTGLDPALADAVFDWIDVDDVARPRGAEREWYARQTPPRAAANRPLRTVGELLLVRGIDARVLERLRPFLSVTGEPGVNPNTAPEAVLLAAWPDPSRVGTLLAARQQGPVECGDLPHCTPRSVSYRVRATGTVGRATRSAEATLRILPTVDATIVAWRWL